MSEKSSYEGTLPNREPQAPRSISIETADKDSAVGRNDKPYNPGSEPNGPQSGTSRSSL